MAGYSFRFLSDRDGREVFDKMYDILWSNMSKIAPTGNGYDEDKAVWLSYREPAFKEGKERTVLMYADDELAGYFQYYANGGSMMVCDLQISAEYQRSFLFGKFLRYMPEVIPDGVKYVDAITSKRNFNLQAIAKKLGIDIIGENKNGLSWRLRGNSDKFKKYWK